MILEELFRYQSIALYRYDIDIYSSDKKMKLVV